MSRPGLFWLALTTVTLALNPAQATPGGQFQQTALAALKALGAKVAPCPDVEAHQLRVCARSRLDPLKVRQKLQAVGGFRNLRAWTPVESMAWAPFTFQGRDAHVIVAPLPDRTVMVEVGLGQFEP